MINGELMVDNFAGGVGASTGMEMATALRQTRNRPFPKSSM